MRLLLGVDWRRISATDDVLEYFDAVYVLLTDDTQDQSLVFFQQLHRIVWVLQDFEHFIKFILSNLLLKEVWEEDRSVGWDWQLRIEEQVLGKQEVLASLFSCTIVPCTAYLILRCLCLLLRLAMIERTDIMMRWLIVRASTYRHLLHYLLLAKGMVVAILCWSVIERTLLIHNVLLLLS